MTTVPVMFLDMPQELLDRIVDYGGDDAVQMANCALACRSLRLRAQKHIFNDITILSTERVIQLIKLIQEAPVISKFLDVIHTSSRHFIPVHGIDAALASLFLLLRV